MLQLISWVATVNTNFIISHGKLQNCYGNVWGEISPYNEQVNLHFSGPSIWNNLDEEIKSLSLRLFKQTSTEQFLSSYA